MNRKLQTCLQFVIFHLFDFHIIICEIVYLLSYHIEMVRNIIVMMLIVMCCVDCMQIVSNDKFKSVIHQASSNATRTRTSVACFFHGQATPPKIYGPIEELVTKESPRNYREFTVKDFMSKFYSRGLDEKSGLNYVRI